VNIYAIKKITARQVDQATFGGSINFNETHYSGEIGTRPHTNRSFFPVNRFSRRVLSLSLSQVSLDAEEENEIREVEATDIACRYTSVYLAPMMRSERRKIEKRDRGNLIKKRNERISPPFPLLSLSLSLYYILLFDPDVFSGGK